MEEIRSLVVRSRAASAEQAERLAAFGRLVERFQDMAYGYAYSVLGDFHLAEDAAQEAFITAFRQLGSLREPAAFAGWLRRLVRTACSRLVREKGPAAVSLAAAEGVSAEGAEPASLVEKTEIRDKVLAAIRSLPQPQREVTTLFYINGYSQKDIAGFLELPVTTVNDRLHASRKRLKERMLTMVEETLHRSAPDERFSAKIIQSLLDRPRPLEIDGHPVLKILNVVREALPEYEYIEGEEIVQKSVFVDYGGNPEHVYHLDEGRILRPETTLATIRAMAGRTPPVRLLTAGRVFRVGARKEDATHSAVFHQCDVLCVEAGADADALKGTVRGVLVAVLGPVELKFDSARYTYFERCLEVSVRAGSEWLNVAGSGMVPAERLGQAGCDARAVSGFAFGMGLERLAMLKYGIDDIRELWRPPYVPG